MNHRYLIPTSASVLSSYNSNIQPQIVSAPRSTAAPSGCPASIDVLASDYYKDGIKAGKADKAAQMNDAYQCH